MSDESYREAPTPDPTAFPYLSVHDSIPLKTEFKPALKVLSRKPAAKAVEVIDPVTGLARLRMEDEDEAEQAGAKPSPDELRERAQREREEKRRRYEEARARILGSGSGSASPGMVTPPVGGEDGRSSRAGKGRGRGGRGVENQRPGSGSGTRELFDPNYSPKTGSVTIQKRNGEGVSSRPDSGRSTPRNEDQIIRAPRGPDGSGRGGFGFVNRGGKNS